MLFNCVHTQQVMMMMMMVMMMMMIYSPSEKLPNAQVASENSTFNN